MRDTHVMHVICTSFSMNYIFWFQKIKINKNERYDIKDNMYFTELLVMIYRNKQHSSAQYRLNLGWYAYALFFSRDNILKWI